MSPPIVSACNSHCMNRRETKNHSWMSSMSSCGWFFYEYNYLFVFLLVSFQIRFKVKTVECHCIEWLEPIKESFRTLHLLLILSRVMKPVECWSKVKDSLNGNTRTRKFNAFHSAARTGLHFKGEQKQVCLPCLKGSIGPSHSFVRVLLLISTAIERTLLIC